MFWIMVSEVPVHESLALLLWARNEVKPHSEKCMLEQSHLLHGDQETERDRDRVQDVPFKDTLPGTYFLQLDPTSSSFQ
jgi:hypothetical protein